VKRSFGALVLDVAAGWDDETVVVLKAPVPEPAVRMRAPTGETRRPTLVVRRLPIASDATLAELVEVEERVLAANMPGAVFHERHDRNVGGHDAVVRELTVPAPDGTLRQLYVTVRVAGALYSFVGTALDDLSFAAARAAFLSVVETARFDG
jgi:hypothetical protein